MELRHVIRTDIWHIVSCARSFYYETESFIRSTFSIIGEHKKKQKCHSLIAKRLEGGRPSSEYTSNHEGITRSFSNFGLDRIWGPGLRCSENGSKSLNFGVRI